MAKMLFTSESVTEGHPDKVSDQVSDAVLDAIFSQDPNARVACETFCTTGVVTVMGEITTTAQVDIPAIVREVVCDIGYNSEKACFNGNNCAVMVSLDKQSPDIAMGVDKSYELKDGEEDAYNLNGAGDQGMMFGYACNETEELMPLAISLAHKMAKRLTDVRKSGELDYLNPDGKTQVTVEYNDGVPTRVDTVVVSSQHTADVSLETLRADILEKVIKPIVPAELLDEETKFFINPTGRFVVAVRLLLIPTAVMLVTAAAHSQAKIPQRLTAALLMHHVGLLKILLPQVLQINVKFSWLMQLVLHVPYL